jgi:cellulose synthase/poly-beta-1,6-N-acetylglucosamine synthase-like glycosyltransferase
LESRETPASRSSGSPGTDTPAVSIVVPVYNRRDLVCRTIRSLLNQDFTRPYEIVVIDDGSSDGSGEAAADLDPRVRVIHQANRGAPAARLRGIEEARAPVLAFQDSDDIAYAHKLTALWNALQAQPHAVLAFGLAKIQAWKRVRLPGGLACKQGGGMIVIEDPLAVLLRYRTIISCMNLMTYRWAAQKAGRVSSFYKASNDYRLQLGLARHGPFVCVDTPLCEYHSGHTSISGTWGEERQLVFSLHAADAAYRLSRPRPALTEAIRSRVEEDGPDMAARLACKGDWKMLARILPILLRHGRWWRMPRPFWWALHKMALERPRDVPVLLGAVARTAKALRRRIRRDVRQDWRRVTFGGH